MFLGVPLYHVGDVGDRVHQLRQVGLILIVFQLVVVGVCEIIHCVCLMEWGASVWVLVGSC